jgi:hypothetical protein
MDQNTAELVSGGQPLMAFQGLFVDLQECGERLPTPNAEKWAARGDSSVELRVDVVKRRFPSMDPWFGHGHDINITPYFPL